VSDQLLWIEVPPPRVANESKLTLALAVAIAVYAMPVATAVDPEALPVELADIGFCCFCGQEPAPDPEEDEELAAATRCPSAPVVERPLSREQAIEQALAVSTVGRAFVWDGDHDAPWRIRTSPQLAAEMQPPLPTNRLATVLAQGTLDRRTVRRYLKRQHRELARCVDPTPSLRLGRSLRDDGDPAMQFLIDRDGRVVQVIPITGSPELAACLEHTVKTFTFPRSAGLTQVHVPLRYGTTETSAGIFVR
jgi:hypothetical protein